MKTILSWNAAREELLRDVIRAPLSETDALLWMVLLHTHSIQLFPGAFPDIPGQTKGSPIVLSEDTQRGVASTIAAVWPDRSDERASYPYWYWQYNTRVPYETLSAVPESLLPRLLQLRDILASDPRVAAVVAQDDDSCVGKELPSD